MKVFLRIVILKLSSHLTHIFSNTHTHTHTHTHTLVVLTDTCTITPICRHELTPEFETCISTHFLKVSVWMLSRHPKFSTCQPELTVCCSSYNGSTVLLPSIPEICCDLSPFFSCWAQEGIVKRGSYSRTSSWSGNMKEMVIWSDRMVFIWIRRLLKFLQCGKFDIWNLCSENSILLCTPGREEISSCKLGIY